VNAGVTRTASARRRPLNFRLEFPSASFTLALFCHLTHTPRRTK
jgi:hypothetical protein